MIYDIAVLVKIGRQCVRARRSAPDVRRAHHVWAVSATGTVHGGCRAAHRADGCPEGDPF